ncbi:MAG TPA: hypothetical protein PK385_07440 [Spirochaetota bacterium]|nr:hypothetical protein [Spirochaetota bacterium]HOS32462.1 hypothetical protein [Spirochaetota bacterium]HOS55875.1 hypothetical protein [Spirochaetota bacterium]HPK62469.1 hypothetical protein [Spirochaetota bacterium]HQF77457.1 hypothetical protein [Spirochaetota bacterium]
MLRKRVLYVYIILIIGVFLFSEDKSYIDWINGKIYSTISVKVKNDYNFPHAKLEKINIARDMAKINYYRILKEINLYESTPVIDYIEQSSISNSRLFYLIDNATLNNIEYPDLNTVKLSYYINMFGDNSLMSILMNERDFYTEKLRSYEGYNFKVGFTGIVIDARGVLQSYDGYDVKVEPCLFVTVKDNEERLVFNQYNVEAEVIKNKGMARYSYDVNEDQSDIVGISPLRIAAYGVGDRNGSIIVVTENDAKKMLADDKTRSAIRSGKIVIIIDR